MKLVGRFLVICILFCSCHSEQANPIKDEDRLRILNYLYKIRYKKEIAAELHYQKYLLEVASKSIGKD